MIDFNGGHEWCILKLGIPGKVFQIEVDTNHFKGNFPESFWVEARKINTDKNAEDQFPIVLLGKHSDLLCPFRPKKKFW